MNAERVEEIAKHIRNLYTAARLAPLKAEEHEQIQRSALEIDKAIKEAQEFLSLTNAKDQAEKS